MNIKHKFRAIVTGFALVMYSMTPVLADDIEIYTAGALGSPTIQPNVMFIVDTSGSMQDPVVVNVPYDYTTVYTGSYNTNQVYYSTTNTAPASNSKQSFDKTANKCDASVQKYDNGTVVNVVGPLEEYGFYSDNIAQYSASKWNAMRSANYNNKQRAYPVECKADSGIHGETAASSNTYIADGAAGWTAIPPADLTNPHPVWSGGANFLYLFDGNYLNYLNGAATTTKSRMVVAKEAVKAIVDTNNNINICLMRFDGAWPYEGGPVIYPCTDVKASRNDFNTRLANLTAGGSTPLSETYYEALRYFGGKEIVYGNASSPSNQAGTKENGNPTFYQTPISDTCQKNYIVYLTDGAPQLDYLSNARKTSLAPTFPAGSCNTDPDPSSTTYALSAYNKDAFSSKTSTRDNCLDELSGWALNNDVAERSTYASHVGKQIITTYTVGFDFDSTNPDLQAAERLLRDTATAGGGRFYEAVSKQSLLDAFGSIVAEILAINSTFSSPAVSVNAFNRATNLDDLYFTLFKPAQGPHWDGNLKKFKLAFDTTNKPFIADQFGSPAVDVGTGFFKDAITSYWTQTADSPDGGETGKGGAASMLSLSRNVYTYTGTYMSAGGVQTPSTAGGSINTVTNKLDDTNSNITDAMLGGVLLKPDVTYVDNGTSYTVSYRIALLKWAFGNDILDTDKDGKALEARRVVGDPLHSEPALVQYGKTVSGDPDLVAYVATNDGYLHAFDSLTGQENYSFVPQKLLSNLSKIFDNSGSSSKSYGLDGNVVPWINDVNKNGTLETGDTAYLFVGMRRGGRDIYSLDVTSKTNPVLRWKIEGGTGNYTELGQTWSTPNIAKLKLNGVSKTVLIFGAGYDTSQDGASSRTPDTVGRGIFIVDALTGDMLWRVGSDAGASTQMANMKYSIPARVKPLDIDGDGFIDRLYAGDMGGQLWRFDIRTGATGITDLTSLITGGRIADLAIDADATQARRFYYPPDVALIAEEGKAPYLSIVAVSGYRAHPLNTIIHDRAYMIRDNDVYNKPADGDYAAKMVTEADLYNTTANLIGGDGTTAQRATAATALSAAKGWYISLEELDGRFIGEKGLAEPLILNGNAIFTTYIPAAVGATTSACRPNDGTGVVYFVDVTDGTPTYFPSGTVGKRPDRQRFLARGGIPPSPNVIITDQGVATLCVGTECEDAKLSNAVEKSYWYEVEQ